MCLVAAGAILLPWAALIAAWAWSGQFWLGVAAMLAGAYLVVSTMSSVSRWRHRDQG